MAKSTSIFDSPPDDLGGIHARKGFSYQDDIAAKFYIHMLSHEALEEVSCETYDDILLVWNSESGPVLEFVQVKAEHPSQLWTVAKLCERKKSPTAPDGTGTSILEKNFNRDRYDETSIFRIVTCRQIDPSLIVLTRDRGHAHRSVDYSEFQSLSDAITEKLGEIKSENGNDCRYWLERAIWEVVSEDDVVNVNQKVLSDAIYGMGLSNDPDTVRNVYENLKALAKSTAELGVEKWDEKRISRGQIIEKVQDWVVPSPEKTKLQRLSLKFSDAGLDDVCLEAAKDERRYYLRRKRSSGYMTIEQAEDLEMEVLDRLHNMRSELDSGLIELDGVQFHQHCLNKVKNIEVTGSMSSGYLSGCMYEITSRCRHRFTRTQS